MMFKRTIISGSIFAALMISGVAVAHTKNNEISQQNTLSQSNMNKGSSLNGGKHSKGNSPGTATELKGIEVTGLREALMRAIQIKNAATNIEDSITAVNIGKLPDLTVTDSLQRIAGVQIGRTAGEGTTVSVRGLPEVSTLLNGMAFITPANIESIQPNFQSIPAALFRRLDVDKSPTAHLLDSGISGSINLRTWKPWDLSNGWTTSITAQAERGEETKKTKPNVSALISYNHDHKWGILISGAYSKNVEQDSNNGMAAGGIIAGENASSAQSSQGFVGAWDGRPIPRDIVQYPDGSVDVNGDGKKSLAMYSDDYFHPMTETKTLARKALTGSFQADLSHGFILSADAFYANLDELDGSIGAQVLPATWDGRTMVPLKYRNTGVHLSNAFNTPGVQSGDWNQTLYTVQSYKFWPADWISQTTASLRRGTTRNFSVGLKFNNGGAFTGRLRVSSASATNVSRENGFGFSTDNGTLWPNIPANAAPPGTIVVPAELGGNRVFNANGFVPMSSPIVFSFPGSGNMQAQVSPELRSVVGNKNDYAFKNFSSSDYNQSAGMNIARFDGGYRFNNNLKLRFGVRNSVRTGREFNFRYAIPLYAGMGASQPGGCYVGEYAADVLMIGSNIPGACIARNSEGYFRTAAMAGLHFDQLPDLLKNNIRQYDNLGNVKGLTEWALDPSAIKNTAKVMDSIFPGYITHQNPSSSWAVSLHELTTYLEGDFNGMMGGFPVSGNAGFRLVKTGLGVTQFGQGGAQPYALAPPATALIRTTRSYTNILPAFNMAVQFTPKFLVRLAASKNMMPLNLSQWGGGLSIGYEIDTSLPGDIDIPTSGHSSGNPNLKPWESTNTGISAEYYLNSQSMISLAAYRINIASFIQNGTVRNCDIPDLDGVVRHHCISITGPVQGAGAKLHGFEFGWREAMAFLPGFYLRQD